MSADCAARAMRSRRTRSWRARAGRARSCRARSTRRPRARAAEASPRSRPTCVRRARSASRAASADVLGRQRAVVAVDPAAHRPARARGRPARGLTAAISVDPGSVTISASPRLSIVTASRRRSSSIRRWAVARSSPISLNAPPRSWSSRGPDGLDALLELALGEAVGGLDELVERAAHRADQHGDQRERAGEREHAGDDDEQERAARVGAGLVAGGRLPRQPGGPGAGWRALRAGASGPSTAVSGAAAVSRGFGRLARPRSARGPGAALVGSPWASERGGRGGGRSRRRRPGRGRRLHPWPLRVAQHLLLGDSSGGEVGARRWRATRC